MEGGGGGVGKGGVGGRDVRWDREGVERRVRVRVRRVRRGRKRGGRAIVEGREWARGELESWPRAQKKKWVSDARASRGNNYSNKKLIRSFVMK